MSNKPCRKSKFSQIRIVPGRLGSKRLCAAGLGIRGENRLEKSRSAWQLCTGACCRVKPRDMCSNLRMFDLGGTLHPPLWFLRYMKAAKEICRCAPCAHLWLPALFIERAKHHKPHRAFSLLRARVIFLSRTRSRFLSRSLAFLFSRSLAPSFSLSLSLTHTLSPIHTHTF